jgi:hypothetical protein
MSEANYTLTGGGGKKILLSFANFSFAGKEKLQGKNLPRFGLGTGFPRTPFETLFAEFLRNSEFLRALKHFREQLH